MPSSLTERIAYINQKQALEAAMLKATKGETKTAAEKPSEAPAEPVAAKPDTDTVLKVQPQSEGSEELKKEIKKVQDSIKKMQAKIDEIYEGLKSLGAVGNKKKGKK